MKNAPLGRNREILLNLTTFRKYVIKIIMPDVFLQSIELGSLRDKEYARRVAQERRLLLFLHVKSKMLILECQHIFGKDMSFPKLKCHVNDLCSYHLHVPLPYDII
jgi:hypothetical protein